jgi:hypothetical protein
MAETAANPDVAWQCSLLPRLVCSDNIRAEGTVLDMATNKPGTPAQLSLQLTALFQLFCQGCVELDERCTARLIWAPQVSLEAVRARPKPVQLHRNFAELEQCGKGCYLCRFWASVVLRECQSDAAAASVRASPHPVEAMPPTAVSRPWIVTINAPSINGDLLAGTALLTGAPYTPGPSKMGESKQGQRAYSFSTAETQDVVHGMP